MLGGQQGEDQEQDPNQDQLPAAMELMEEVEVEEIQPQPPASRDVLSTPLCYFG